VISFLAYEMLQRLADLSVSSYQDAVNIPSFDYDFLTRSEIHLPSDLLRNRYLKFLRDSSFWQSSSLPAISGSRNKYTVYRIRCSHFCAHRERSIRHSSQSNMMSPQNYTTHPPSNLAGERMPRGCVQTKMRPSPCASGFVRALRFEPKPSCRLVVRKISLPTPLLHAYECLLVRGVGHSPTLSKGRIRTHEGLRHGIAHPRTSTLAPRARILSVARVAKA